jgi:hypothetical protein
MASDYVAKVYGADPVYEEVARTANRHIITPIGTITGTGKNLSSMLVCRLYRDATGSLATDDYSDDAGLLEIDFHYQIERPGSRDEYSN